jgi:hypothetical protein
MPWFEQLSSGFRKKGRVPIFVSAINERGPVKLLLKDRRALCSQRRESQWSEKTLNLKSTIVFIAWWIKS